MTAAPVASLARYIDAVDRADTLPLQGRVLRVVGLLIESEGPRARLGEVCDVVSGDTILPVQVVGFRGGTLLTVPLGELAGIRPGDRIIARQGAISVPVGPQLLGRVVDALGRPLDDLPLRLPDRVPLHPPPLNPMQRDTVSTPLPTGVRAIDGLLTCGRGQRLGLFGGSGVGKSTLLGMMTRGTAADVIVMALVGERGREVRSFIDHDLGPRGLERSVVVVSTSDNPPLLRMRAAYTATSMAEYFRDQGKHVLLIMDSLTRYAMAQREIALAIGEPPATKGYPPSVFAKLPQLVERAGNGIEGGGSITAFYTVLVEGDDQQDPVADSARAILDGHIVLSRSLADQGHYPAIDIESSVSRALTSLVSPEDLALVRRFKAYYSRYQRNRDLITVGAYAPGSDNLLDRAIALHPQMETFLQQNIDEKAPYDDALGHMQSLAGGAAE